MVHTVTSEYTTKDEDTASKLESTTAAGADDVKKASEDQQPFVKSESEQKLVRKIVLTVMPLVIWIALLQFADKSSVSVAPALGIFQDIDDGSLTGTQFSWLASIFFIGHLVCQPINNILLQKLPVGRLTGLCVLIWGSLLALRFLLGLFEGNSLPSIYLIVSTLFRRSEQATYYGYINSANGLGIILQNLVAYGILQMGDQRDIVMWRWVQIIFGSITMPLGVLCFFFLVDSPKSSLLRLTEEEKAIVEKRARDNAVVRHKKLKWGQMLEAMLEIRFWCICLATFGLTMQGGGLQTYNLIILSGIGTFTTGETILLKLPSGVIMSLRVIFATILAQRTRHLCYSAIAACLLSFAGCVMLAVANQTAVKLLGLYLTVLYPGSYSILTAIIGANVSGYSKKIFYNGALVVSMTVGNFIGPLIMLERQAPRYIGGMTAFCIGNGVALVCFALMRFIMKNENEDRLANPPAKPTDVNLDLTDREDRSFIYHL